VFGCLSQEKLHEADTYEMRQGAYVHVAQGSLEEGSAVTRHSGICTAHRPAHGHHGTCCGFGGSCAVVLGGNQCGDFLPEPDAFCCSPLP
jgi:hypothetical protein